MIYRAFQAEKLSMLGFGLMRLPCLDSDDAKIDEDAFAEMVDYAISHGVNYFDTAWGYHGGNSEHATGKALAKYPRESFYLATKFPGYSAKYFGKVEEVFETQLERCGVSYFDFYLLHNVSERNVEHYLNDGAYHTIPYLLEQKAKGRIRHLGFSAHGSCDCMRRFLEKRGADMEFCQIQLNYIDWSFQDAKAKVDLLNEYHIPVWVMEPLRGGKLATLSPSDAEKLKTLRADESVPAWAFRFLQSIPNVSMILSGMSNLAQLKDNVATFATEKPLSHAEQSALLSVADGMIRADALPCTQCRYCASQCPLELDIPALIALYNEHKFTGGGFIAPMAIRSMPEERRPSACIGCKSCEQVCPQQIDISGMMNELAEMVKA